MSKKQYHIIRRQVFDMALLPDIPAQKFQKELSDVYYREILPALSSICDELADEDTYIRIDSLEINLWDIPKESYQEHLKEMIVQKFREELLQITRKSTSSHKHSEIQILDGTQSELESWIFYCETGLTPWWENQTLKSLDLKERTKRILQKSPGTLQSSLKKLVVQDQVRIRWAKQLDDVQLVQLLQKFQSLNQTDPLVTILHQLCKEIESDREFWLQKLHMHREVFWREFLAVIAQNSSFQTEKELFKEVFTRIFSQRPISTAVSLAEIQHKMRTVFPDVSSDTFGVMPQEESQKLLTLKPTNAQESLDAKTKKNQSSEKAIEIKHKAAILSEIHSSENQSKLQTLENEEIISEKHGEFDSTTPFQKKKLQNPSPLEKNPSSLQYDAYPWRLQKALEEGIFIENAGLVLLWPFLEGCFSELGYLENKTFVDPQKQERAVFLLQYLASKDENCHESQLLLNKILCAWDLEEPLSAEITLEENEKKECEILLRKVIEHWKALKNTSPDTLRGTYLRREGRVQVKGDHIQVIIEQQAYDILMQSLPWGVSLIVLPWLKSFIYVTW